MLQSPVLREARALNELSSGPGPYSKDTYAWVKGECLKGVREAQLLYFSQVAEGFIKDFDWDLLEKWVQEEVQREPGSGYTMLATMYSAEFPGPVDLVKSMRYLELGAEAGNEDCKMFLESMPEDLKGELKDVFEEAAQNPHRLNYYVHYECENYAEAFEALKLWHDLEPDDVECLERMAMCYACGEGVEENRTKAFSIYCEAAEKGSGLSQFFAGSMCLEGVGCKKNLKAGVAYLEKAVAQQLPEAFAVLGNCYEVGRGVKANIKKAIALYEKGAELESPESCCIMAAHCAQGTVHAPDLEKAWEYVRKAEEFATPESNPAAQQIRTTKEMLRSLEAPSDEVSMEDILKELDKEFLGDEDFSDDDFDDMMFGGTVVYTEEEAEEDYQKLMQGIEEQDEKAIYFRLACGLERAAEEPRFREAAWKVLNEKLLGKRLHGELVKDIQDMARESESLCLLCGDMFYHGVGVKASPTTAYRYYEKAELYQDCPDIYLRVLLGLVEKRWTSAINKNKERWMDIARACSEDDARIAYLLGLMYATGCVKNAGAEDAENAFAQAKALGMKRHPEQDVADIQAGKLSYRECVLPHPTFPEMDS